MSLSLYGHNDLHDCCHVYIWSWGYAVSTVVRYMGILLHGCRITDQKCHMYTSKYMFHVHVILTLYSANGSMGSSTAIMSSKVWIICMMIIRIVNKLLRAVIIVMLFVLWGIPPTGFPRLQFQQNNVIYRSWTWCSMKYSRDLFATSEHWIFTFNICHVWTTAAVAIKYFIMAALIWVNIIWL